EEEARAASNERGNNEERQEVIERTGRDREDLVGNRREARDEHRDEPPLREELRRRDVLIPITGLPEPRLDRIEREPADRIAGNAADDRGERRDEREPPAATRRRERHRREHHVGRDGEERRFGEAQRREIARRVRMT